MTRFFYNFNKVMEKLLNFLVFICLTPEYLVKIRITDNKFLTPQFLENNCPISAISAP